MTSRPHLEAAKSHPPTSPPYPIQVKTSTRLVNLPSRWWRNGSGRLTCFLGLGLLSLLLAHLTTLLHTNWRHKLSVLFRCPIADDDGKPSFWDAWVRDGAFAGRSFLFYLPRRSLSWSKGQTGLDRFHAQQQHQTNRLILIPLNTYDNTLAKHHKYKHTHNFPLIIHRLPPSPRLTRKSSLTSPNNPPRHVLPTPIRPRHRPQCHKRRRMFPRQPYPLLWRAGPHLKNVLVALLQPSLKVAVAPVARQLVVEPVRRNVRCGMAVGVVFSVGG